ncbi:exodeoxyribonuclease-5 [Saccharicrinis carchari]|uniref:Exodeoxyribonuclease-5 n=1 Tax=Saccharicrinis carchari TaxID=1168039 RepID=A0A521AQ72_SACCC|nr:AAA family ATPase [Saccharicrinis carchari]SMO36974.1 exodeoxyribonuclease-5 [Saccharicrinis carchari]
MINKHLISIITQHFKHNPTPSQEKTIEKFADFLTEQNEHPIFLLKGYAGTGKTSLVSSFVEALGELNFKMVLMAPTGRAAKVFSSYAQYPAHTVHKIIYRQKSANDGFGSFNLNKNLKPETIFFVDEASMIHGSSAEYSGFGTGNLMEDLLNFVFEGHNCRLVLIGDAAQLPPVGNSESPALNMDTLKYYSESVTECFLWDVVRQSSKSGVLSCASDLRFQIESENILDNLPKINIEGYNDVKRLTGEELIDAITTSYDTVGMDETLIVNRSNKRTNLYNKGIRNSILYKEEELTVGDIILVVKNNYHWLKNSKEVDFIANGDIAEIVRIKGYEELYGHRFVNCVVRLLDYKELEVDVKLMLDVLNLDTPGLSQKEQEQFFYTVMEDYVDLTPKRKQYQAVKNNDYYNALQVKFAYAMTCHKAQGGQWKSVFVDPGFVPDQNINRDYYRWLYTAFTRCTEKLYLVNFKEDYFE